MSIKAEIINQFVGFGNDVPRSRSEYYRGMGVLRGAYGLVFGQRLYQWKDASDFADITLNDITSMCVAEGIPVGDSSKSGKYVFFNDVNANFLQSLSGVLTPEVPHRSQQTQNGRGMITDQKGRVLYFHSRYLGMFDPESTNYTTGSVSVTNGSTTITGSGTNWDSSMVDKAFRLNGGNKFYRISAFVSTTQLTLANSYGEATASGQSYTINTAWDDKWKDFGSDMAQPFKGGSAYCPSETYEDTVLIGRNNKIVTLNTVTDTITTDASPAFELPEGFDILHIHKGATGILLAGEFRGKTQLVLWDNDSTRSIAPWIEIDEPLISATKWRGGWVIITTRRIYYTNGYSLTLIAENILDSSSNPLGSLSNYPNTSLVDGNDLYFSQTINQSGKRRAGLYRFNLVTKVFEFVPRLDINLVDTYVSCIFKYDPYSRLFCGSSGITYLSNYPAPVQSYITNPVGQGVNTKIAEGLKVPLHVDSRWLNSQAEINFTMVAKISPMDKAIKKYMQVKTTMTAYDTIVVNGTSWDAPAVGDELEFLEDENAGITRNVTAVSGAGTATMTITVDRDFPEYSTTNAVIVITPFRLIGIKNYSDITVLPKDVYFNIKNKVKGRKFMIKFEIYDADTPIEVLPFMFIYDDKGVIE